MEKHNHNSNDLFESKNLDKLENRFGFQWWIIIILIGFTIWQFAKISELEKEQDKISSELFTIKSNITEIKLNIDDIESNNDELDWRVQWLEDDYDDIESRIRSLE